MKDTSPGALWRGTSPLSPKLDKLFEGFHIPDFVDFGHSTLIAPDELLRCGWSIYRARHEHRFGQNSVAKEWQFVERFRLELMARMGFEDFDQLRLSLQKIDWGLIKVTEPWRADKQLERFGNALVELVELLSEPLSHEDRHRTAWSLMASLRHHWKRHPEVASADARQIEAVLASPPDWMPASVLDELKLDLAAYYSALKTSR